MLVDGSAQRWSWGCYFGRYVAEQLGYKTANCTYFWIVGDGAVPFAKQCCDYGVTAPLVAPMADNFVEEELAELGDAGIGMLS